MAEERKENIMSKELAFRRELAYREKIASFLSEKEIAELLPLEVPFSTTFTSPYPRPMQLVGQSSTSPPRPSPGRCPTSAPPNPSYQDKSPAPTPGSGPGKATTSSLDCFQNQRPEQYDISNRSETFCKICKVSCSSQYNYKQHMRGQKHKAKVHSPQLNRNGAVGPTKNPQPRCNLCQILCTDETGLRLHLNGQKHKAKLRIIEFGEKDKTSQQFWCELCQVPCTNEETFQQHLKGRYHAARKSALEEEKNIV